jgi:hypothetical protein
MRRCAHVTTTTYPGRSHFKLLVPTWPPPLRQTTPCSHCAVLGVASPSPATHQCWWRVVRCLAVPRLTMREATSSCQSTTAHCHDHPGHPKEIALVHMPSTSEHRHTSSNASSTCTPELHQDVARDLLYEAPLRGEKHRWALPAPPYLCSMFARYHKLMPSVLSMDTNFVTPCTAPPPSCARSWTTCSPWWWTIDKVHLLNAFAFSYPLATSVDHPDKKGGRIPPLSMCRACLHTQPRHELEHAPDHVSPPE